MVREAALLRRAHSLRGRLWDGEGACSVRSLLGLMASALGVARRGARNAQSVALRENVVAIPHLPAGLDGFRVLHLSDLHVEHSEGQLVRVRDLLRSGVRFDACVFTGDFRADVRGDVCRTVPPMRRLASLIRQPMYAVLGNHDPLDLAAHLEKAGIRVLCNESELLRVGGAHLCIAGIDDAHYFGTGDVASAAAANPAADVAILLSHTPAVYAEAAAAGFHVLLSGHTHGGQICLPGGVPVMVEAPRLPRHMARGPWRFGALCGYTSTGLGTSLAPLRFNCPPEVTLHTLTRAGEP